MAAKLRADRLRADKARTAQWRAAGARVSRRAARLLAWAAGVATALLLGVSLYVQTPGFRGHLIAALNRSLEGSVRGRITLDGLTRLGLSGAQLATLRVDGEAGQPVLILEEVTVRFDLLDVLGPWLPSPRAGLSLEHVRVNRARVWIASDPGSGELTLARAFGRATPSRGPKRPAPLTYTFESIELGEVALDVDHPVLGQRAVRMDRVHGNAVVGGEDSEVRVDRFGVLLLEGGTRWLEGTGTFQLLPKGVLGGSFHGFVRGTELDLALQVDGGVLTARLDVPRAVPERVRELWPGWPLQAPVAARAVARGPLGALALEGQVMSEGARADITGSAALEGAPRLHLDVAAHGLDLRAVVRGAPATALDARASLDLHRSGEGWGATVDATTEPTSIAGVALPSLQLSLQTGGGVATAHYALGDARGRLEGDVALARDGGAEVTARFTHVSLAAWPELRGRVAGRLDGRARAHVADGRVTGSVEGRFERVTAGDAAIASGNWRAGFEGALAAPDEAELDVTLTGRELRLGPLRLAQIQARARGPWHTSRVDAELGGDAGARGNVRARLALRGGVRVAPLSLRWADRDVVLDAEIERWSPEAGLLSLKRLALSGAAGSLEGSARLAPGQIEVQAHADRLDSELAARALGLGALPLRGVFSGSATLSSTPQQARGELALRGEKLRVQNLTVTALDARATLTDEHVELELTARDRSLGSAELRGAGELGGRPLELDAWRRATGSGELSVRQLPLWPLGLVLARTSRVEELDGRLDLALKVERADASVLPDLYLEATTEELEFALAPDGPGAESQRFERYVVQGSASIAGQSGQGLASVRVTDEHGALVTTSGSLALDLDALWREPEAILQRLFRTPLDALVRLHPRPVSLLPDPLGVRDLAGNVEATLQLRGSLAEPTLALAARGHRLQGGVAEGPRAVDVTSVVEYAPTTGRLRGTAAVEQGGKSLVAARVEGRVPSPFEPGVGDRVALRAAAMLNGAPLELLPPAARERIQARLYGSIDLEKEPGEPLRQRAQLEIADLTAHDHALGNGRLTYDNRRDGLRAHLRIGSSDHYLRASVRGPAAGSAADAPIEGSLAARNFDAASLAPLTSGLLSRLGGSLNADLAFSMKPDPGSSWYLGIDGDATLASGSAHIEELGLEVRDIEATARARSTPEHTVILIEPFAAKARSRSQNLQGQAELWLRGERVVSGEASVSLDAVPLSLEGVPRGIARGHVLARLQREPDHLRVEVELPDLRVRLPPSSTRALIGLEPNPDWHVLQATPEEEAPSGDALHWVIPIELGADVRIQRGDLDVPLTGQVTLDFQQEVRPSGAIATLPGGHITLFNQSFNVDHGLVQLVPDEPDNPRVDLTASWRAPDGTTVYVDVTGRAKDATVLTRDDRGLEEVERFYLLTGGAMPEGRVIADGGTADSGAIGQTFSLGINELLRNSLGNVAVSVGSTPDDRASYSARVRLSDKLTFQGSFQPGSESSREESANDLTGTLDYRIGRRWSLRTELGTSGGAFDLLWSHRY